MKSWNRVRLGWYLNLSRAKPAKTLVRHLKQVLGNNLDTTRHVQSHNHIRKLHATRHPRFNVHSVSDERDLTALVDRISEQTKSANRNNLTRTDAYIRFFEDHREIHWALLAHCVSRNGGWCMTDLQGEWFRHIATEQQGEQVFSFLERSNWLIFQDAYPQLLLYAESSRRQKNLSFLLPSFGVSSFMKAMWDWFWVTKDEDLLTRALIINEQNYIESRVVQNPHYKATVEHSASFQMESLLNLNQVLIPYHLDGRTLLAGTTVRHFQSIENRIVTGLRLYRSLYQHKRTHDAMVEFMRTTHHRATREDYWPELFSTTEASNHRYPYEPILHRPKQTDRLSARPESLQHLSGHHKIYSPTLDAAWPNVRHKPAEHGDWFVNLNHVYYLFCKVPDQPLDITEDYLDSIHTIEKTIQMKEQAASVLPSHMSAR